MSVFRSSQTDLRTVTVRATGNTLAHRLGVAATLSGWYRCPSALPEQEDPPSMTAEQLLATDVAERR
ncbi:MAG TPA: hypothetical protein VJT79_13090, partial [Pseudonocardia sp.]|nr:hypothetical protein [Pseudonocardia sp.]